MKRVIILIIAIFLLFSAIACEFAGITIDLGEGSGGTGPAAIEAGIDSPSNNASLQMAPVEIAYHASSTDGIAAVELSIDGAVVSSISSPSSDQKIVALKYTWNPMEPGNHTIRVRAQSNAGNWSDYYGAMVTVIGEAQPPAQQQPDQAPTDTPQPTATPDQMTLFDIEHNKDKFYYSGGGCDREITISAKVTHPEDAYAVVLFTRFWDKEGAGLTKWDSGRAMSKKSEGTYSVTLFSENIPNYSMFEFAIMYYQIVVQDKGGSSLARSEVIKEVTLEICQ